LIRLDQLSLLSRKIRKWFKLQGSGRKAQRQKLEKKKGGGKIDRASWVGRLGRFDDQRQHLTAYFGAVRYWMDLYRDHL
jgi:hypothetical protein